MSADRGAGGGSSRGEGLGLKPQEQGLVLGGARERQRVVARGAGTFARAGALVALLRNVRKVRTHAKVVGGCELSIHGDWVVAGVHGQPRFGGGEAGVGGRRRRARAWACGSRPGP